MGSRQFDAPVCAARPGQVRAQGLQLGYLEGAWAPPLGVEGTADSHLHLKRHPVQLQYITVIKRLQNLNPDGCGAPPRRSCRCALDCPLRNGYRRVKARVSALNDFEKVCARRVPDAGRLLLLTLRGGGCDCCECRRRGRVTSRNFERLSR